MPDGTVLTSGRPALTSSADDGPVGAAVPNGSGVPLNPTAAFAEQLLRSLARPLPVPALLGAAASLPEELQAVSATSAAPAAATTTARDRGRGRRV